MKRIETREMERKLSFVLKERDKGWGKSGPKEYSRVLVVKGYRVVVSGSTLFLNEKRFEDDVIYLSKDGEKIVVTKQNEIIILNFSNSAIERISMEAKIKRGEVWGEYLGILSEDGCVDVFKDGRYVKRWEDVKDFLLPDFIVGVDEKFKDYKGVKKLLRSCSGDGIIVVTEKSLILGNSETENILHRGDVDYDRNSEPCYYHCDLHGVNLLGSSNSSKFLLLGSDLQELELEEEIKLLGLRTDEEFNVRYLTGMDYSGEYVYLIDEDGVLSRFETCGIESEKEVGGDINFTEKRYTISKEGGLKIIGEEDTVLLDKKEEKEKTTFSSLNSLLDSAKENNTSIEKEENKPQEDASTSCIKSTGDSRVDALLESIASQIDEISRDFQSIRVEKKTFRMYKYNANDLSLSVEQVYGNIMRLERYKSIENEMAEQLSLMLSSLEVYKGIDEESVKNAIRFIDSSIEGISKGRRKRVVHYTKPLFYGIEKVEGVGHRLDMTSPRVQKTLENVDYIEKKLENDDLGGSFVDHFSLNQGPVDNIEEKKEKPAQQQRDTFPKKVEDRPPKDLATNEVVPKETHLPPSTQTIQNSSIFGQPISQTGSPQFGGLFGNFSPSNIFQSITSNPPPIPPTLQKKEEESDQSVPNAFSRFANSRSLFK
ncbi:uncharacterized protein Eint_060440 [Encephalitozoon intestinalis ATCC 50506]|uniref:Uncharacterized protein n=1 Tax=Encephalitozoon intestinalis (strain ATCC 50506) TaxID=876142 RepID=E0S7H3_ENCIT|nr:uncharacterized protein Eint_060440 [Encephalitozoon intestinalis ATCC 50506]ADM11652.1 hypothetical protein Eint_060440 [Encephalitozoon intestinalis ATCC 50506]UTX45386.1 hypothetical protein GPK93_06g09380 [Encephalitozoon intestinalis]